MNEDDRKKYIEELMQPHIPLRVLQEIRTEIDKEKQSRCFNDMFEYITGIDDALAIIDKHIKEFEG